MSTTYAGQFANEQPGPAAGVGAWKSVVAATGNGVSPIVLTTAAAHGLTAGEFVWVTGVEGNTAANGQWFVDPTAANTLALYGNWSGGAPATPSTGNGAWTSGGSVRPQGWVATTTLPSDGDAPSAASVNVPLEAVIDRAGWTAYALPRCRMISAKRLYLSAATPTTSTGLIGVPASSVWVAPSPLNSNLYDGTTFNGAYFDALPGDLFDVTLTGYVALSGGGSIALRLAYEAEEYGASFTGTATAGLLGSAKVYATNTGVLLTTKQTISSGTHGKKIIFLLQDYLVSGSPSYQFNGDIELAIVQYRPNY